MKQETSEIISVIEKEYKDRFKRIEALEAMVKVEREQT